MNNAKGKVLTLVAVAIVIIFVYSFCSYTSLPKIRGAQQTTLTPDRQSTTGPIPPEVPIGGADQVGLGYSPGPVSKIISGVPAYIWRDGCGPTSATMILGYWSNYWSSYGYDWIIPGNASTQTDAVNQVIASSQHEADYSYPVDEYPSLLLDKSELPLGDEHKSNSVADFMSTSFSSRQNYFGWSWFSDMPKGYLGYLAYVNPGQFIVSSENLKLPEYGGTLTWEAFKTSIDKNIPMLLLVDSTKDGQTDHFVPAFGYDDSTSIKMYAAYNTWDTQIHWYVWEPMNIKTAYGVYGGTTLNITRESPTTTPTKRPTTTQTPTLAPTITRTPTSSITPNGTIINTVTPTPDRRIIMSGMSTLVLGETPDIFRLLIAALGVLYIFAQSAERAIVVAKPLLDKIKDGTISASVKVFASFLIGLGLAAGFRYDLFANLMITGTPPIAGYLAVGIVTSGGSSGIHAVLEWLKTIPTPTTKTTITTKTPSDTPPAQVTTTITHPPEQGS